MIYKVTDIVYDTDGEDFDLPEELNIDVPDDIETDYEKLEFISDAISDITGFCHEGFTTFPTLNG